jgi:hypothetical protein
MAHGLAFQTIVIVDDGTDESLSLSPRDPPGLKVQLSERSPVALPKHPLTRRVNQEIEILAVRIRQMMQLRGGVLLTISLQWRAETEDGDKPAYKLNWVTVDRPGPVPSLVLRTELTSHPREGHADEGFVHRHIYLWATAA